MATIQFKGKELVRNFHLTVPYHELVPDEKKGLTKKISLNDNLIIHGDNLLALKALLPTYAGKVKCIYIDPPYNTGTEKWVYNDNVNSPMIKEWLGKVVDKDDLTRHEKWLCMMMPRLKLLRELLTDDGVIFISIDDNEQSNLRLIMDEVFGEDCFIANVTIENDSRTRQYDAIGVTHEYVLIYSKSEYFNYNILKDENKKFQYEDSEGGFDIYELRNRNVSFNKDNRPNLYYPFWVNPNNPDKNGFYNISLDEVKSWIKTYPQESQNIKTVWRWGEETAAKKLNTVLFARKHSNGFFQIIKKYRGVSYSLNSVWTDKEIKTDKGTLEIKSLFDNKKIFDYPKPCALIKRLLTVFSEDDSIILDSFAGSGTTAHATLALNKEDDGDRKFILIQMPEEIEKDNQAYKMGFREVIDITTERVRRVIKGVKGAKDDNLQKGLGGTFSYFGLGKPIDVARILKGKDLPSFVEMARYIFYTATGEEFNEKKVNDKTGLIGESKEYQVYLLYKPDMVYLKSTALTLERAEALGKFAGKKRLVFAPAKYLDQEHLERLHIDFAQLPFEIYQKQ